MLPDISITHDGGSDAIYAGRVLTLSCAVTLHSLMPESLTVSLAWTEGIGNNDLMNDGRISVQSASLTPGGKTFLSTLQFNTVHKSDSGTYTCTSTVTPSGPLPLSEGRTSKAINISVSSKYFHM